MFIVSDTIIESTTVVRGAYSHMPQIYVIYRPEDSRKRSQEILSALEKQYGANNIKSPNFDGYLDVYQIEQDVQKSQYLLVIIGNYWADMVDETGQNLLKNVYDPVHMAIATAINSRKRTIPILVDGASMPRASRLPREIRPITALDPITISKNENLQKALNKGLKDTIKRGALGRLPDITSQFAMPKQSSASTPPRLRRQSISPRRDWQYWFKRGVLPTIALAIIGFSLALMLVPRTVETSVVASRESLPTLIPTVAPTSTATIMTEQNSTVTELAPTITTTQMPPITVETAEQLQEITGETAQLDSTANFIFSEDETLFIFVSQELQEVQLIEVATNEILRVIEFSPDTPLYVALNDDETRLYVLSSAGISTWGIPTQ